MVIRINNSSIKAQLASYLSARNELEGGLYLDKEIIDALRGSNNSLQDFEKSISGCVKCEIGKSRTKFVFGDGNENADIVFIGEAPGHDEDLQGIPFVGRAGKLLDEILQDFGFTRKEVYICNILKCRPPGNRDPKPEEINNCEPYLWRQLELINPSMIVAVGRIAAQTLLKNETPIGKMRGTTFLYQGIPLFVIYHPAAVLRNPHFRENVNEDMKKIKAYYEKLMKE